MERNLVYLTLHTMLEGIGYCVCSSNVQKVLDCSLRNSRHLANLSFHRQVFPTNCRSWSSGLWQTLWDSRSPWYPTCILGCAVFPLNFTGIKIAWDNVFHRAIRAHSFRLSSQNIRQLCLGSCDPNSISGSTMEVTTLAHDGRDWGIRLKPRSGFLQEALWASSLMHIPSSSSAVMLHTRYLGSQDRRVFDTTLQMWKLKI